MSFACSNGNAPLGMHSGACLLPAHHGGPIAASMPSQQLARYCRAGCWCCSSLALFNYGKQGRWPLGSRPSPHRSASKVALQPMAPCQALIRSR